MKFGVYKDNKMEIFDDKDAILILNLSEDDKTMVQNMADEDMNFLKTEVPVETPHLANVMCMFKKLCD